MARNMCIFVISNKAIGFLLLAIGPLLTRKKRVNSPQQMATSISKYDRRAPTGQQLTSQQALKIKHEIT